jgi:SAM-dependent methyltransferase
MGNKHGHGHTHDGIDWRTRLVALRRADELGAPANQDVAARLVGLLDKPRPVVVDLGSGAGGMSAALAVALGGRDGGRVVPADAVPELLDAATAHTVTVAARTAAPVEVEPVQVDAASEQLAELLPAADLVWASRVVHHLPDQQRAIERLADVLAPGGWLALGEGGLHTRCLPWDLGVGEPGLADRLTAARDEWFVRMRTEMPDAVRLPVGWNRALSDAGLTEVSSFSYLIDLPAPASEAVRQFAVDWLTWMGDVGEDTLSDSDRQAIARLLDPADDAYLGHRDDVFLLGASTVYLGRKAR